MSPKHKETPPGLEGNCQSCGTPFIGKYCYQCGEKKRSPHDLSIPHFLEQSVDTITHFDGKFFKSVRYLVFYPGKLTQELLAGRRVSLMKPFQLYLVIAVIFYFFFKNWDIFYNKLQFVIMENGGSDETLIPRQDLKGFESFVFEQARQEAQQHGMSLSQYVYFLDSKVGDYSKAFILLVIPFMGLALWALYFNRQKRYVAHLIHALHLFTFYLLLATIWLETYVLVFSRFFDKFQGNIAFMPLNFVYIAYYYLSFRRLYKEESIPLTVLKAALFTGACLVIFFLYRVAIVFITMWMT